MKASIDLTTGLMIESQSSAADETLLANANSAGFNNVEIRTVTDVEHAALIAARIPFPQRVAEAISNSYVDVDAIYAAAIGNRKTEYEEAEKAALAYQAAGYTGTVSPYVADYAVAAGITNQQSADLIIARAAGLRAAVLAMRSTRFTTQAAMRAATTQAELDAAVAAWAAFIAQVRASLGL